MHWMQELQKAQPFSAWGHSISINMSVVQTHATLSWQILLQFVVAGDSLNTNLWA